MRRILIEIWRRGLSLSLALCLILGLAGLIGLGGEARAEELRHEELRHEELRPLSSLKATEPILFRDQSSCALGLGTGSLRLLLEGAELKTDSALAMSKGARVGLECRWKNWSARFAFEDRALPLAEPVTHEGSQWSHLAYHYQTLQLGYDLSLIRNRLALNLALGRYQLDRTLGGYGISGQSDQSLELAKDSGYGWSVRPLWIFRPGLMLALEWEAPLDSVAWKGASSAQLLYWVRF